LAIVKRRLEKDISRNHNRLGLDFFFFLTWATKQLPTTKQGHPSNCTEISWQWIRKTTWQPV